MWRSSGGLKEVLGVPTKIFSSSWAACDNSAVFNPQYIGFNKWIKFGSVCTCPWYKHSISFNNADIHVSVDHVIEISNEILIWVQTEHADDGEK